MSQLFSKNEKKLLKSLVNKYNFMTANCEDNHLKKSRVKEAWLHIQNEFNLISSQKRTLTQLQRCWAKLKKTKKISSDSPDNSPLPIVKSYETSTYLSPTVKETQIRSTIAISDNKDRGDISDGRRISYCQLQNIINNRKKTNDVSVSQVVASSSSVQFENVVSELHILQRKELNLNIKAAEKRNRILEIDLKRAQIELNNAIEIGKRMIDISDIKMRKASKFTKAKN